MGSVGVLEGLRERDVRCLCPAHRIARRKCREYVGVMGNVSAKVGLEGKRVRR